MATQGKIEYPTPYDKVYFDKTHAIWKVLSDACNNGQGVLVALDQAGYVVLQKAEIERLQEALTKIANLTPEMIDVLPLDRAFRSLRDATKIARNALTDAGKGRTGPLASAATRNEWPIEHCSGQENNCEQDEGA
jgi:hypothetical protein